jgi:hypothetical protein
MVVNSYKIEDYISVGHVFASASNRLSGDTTLYRRSTEFSAASLQKPEHSHWNLVSQVLKILV